MPRSARRARTLARSAALCLALTAPWSLAKAAGRSEADEARASAAYEAALVAVGHRDYANAAELFAEADAIVPNVVALRSAIDAAVLADDAVLAIRLADRAALRPEDGALEESASKARAKLEQRTGKVLVKCDPRRCTATVDGLPAPVGEPLVVGVGKHAVLIDDAGSATRRELDVPSGSTVEAVPASPAERAGAADEAHEEGWSPAFFWVGLGTTVVLGGVTIGSAVDTRDRHDEYLATGQGSDDGRSAQTRTNVLFFTTLGLGIATAAIGVFAVGWSSDDETAVTAVAGPAGAAVVGRFR